MADMTEMEWLNSKSPRAMLMALERCAGMQGIDRKLRLFACSCVRNVWDMIGDERSREAVEVAERYADGMADRSELEAANFAARDAVRDAAISGGIHDYHTRLEDMELLRSGHGEDHGASPEERGWDLAHAARWTTASDHDNSHNEVAFNRGAWMAAKTAAKNTHQAVAGVTELMASGASVDSRCFYNDSWQSERLRCIFGNPFRPATIDPTWLTCPVVSLARVIYENQAFECMAILGDAIQDAGCTDEMILAHCRGPIGHGRGCWVIDHLLRKA